VDSRGVAAVENRELFGILKARKLTTDSSYVEYVSKHIVSGLPIKLGGENLEKVGFFFFPRRIPKIDSVALKGKNVFIKTFFTQGKIRIEKTSNFGEVYRIAFWLFSWGIPTHIEDISGMLVIDKS